MAFDIDISEAAGVRYLHFGSDWVQGAMRIARPWALELEYTREMMAALLMRQGASWPRRILLIGLGAGSLTKFLYRHRPDSKMVAVEISAQVAYVARQHFRLPEDDARLKTVIADGAEYVMKNGPRFDLILVDGFDDNASAGLLDSLPFLLNVRQRLAPEGILAINLLSRQRGFRASVERLQQAFDGRCQVFPRDGAGNAIGFATLGRPVRLDADQLRDAALALKQATGLKLEDTVARLIQAAGKTRNPIDF
ncbi:spermidine synthase [Denitratisoma sp. agr-D3]